MCDENGVLQVGQQRVLVVNLVPEEHQEPGERRAPLNSLPRQGASRTEHRLGRPETCGCGRRRGGGGWRARVGCSLQDLRWLDIPAAGFWVYPHGRQDGHRHQLSRRAAGGPGLATDSLPVPKAGICLDSCPRNSKSDSRGLSGPPSSPTPPPQLRVLSVPSPLTGITEPSHLPLHAPPQAPGARGAAPARGLVLAPVTGRWSDRAGAG